MSDGLVAMLVQGGVAVGYFVAWPVFVYNWTLSMTPGSPLTISERTYFDIEETFFEILKTRIGQVIHANSHRNLSPEQLDQLIQFDLDSSFRLMALVRGRRKEVIKAARRRFVSVVAIWSCLLVSLTFALFSLRVTANDDKYALEIASVPLLVVAVVLFAANLIAVFVAKHHCEILTAAMTDLERSRDEIRV